MLEKLKEIVDNYNKKYKSNFVHKDDITGALISRERGDITMYENSLDTYCIRIGTKTKGDTIVIAFLILKSIRESYPDFKYKLLNSSYGYYIIFEYEK